MKSYFPGTFHTNGQYGDDDPEDYRHRQPILAVDRIFPF